MEYLTTEEVRGWVNSQIDDAYYCEDCLTRLVQTDEGKWYCPNEMCLQDDEITITEED